MDKQATYTFRLDADLKKAFNEIAANIDRPAAQLLRDYMRDVVQQHRQRELRLAKK